MLVVLLIGHSFNLLINLLGAFVHPLRLQYVEFFGKFYEDGGEHFTPLALRERKTAIHR
jgi:V/A-type H+-transporting ATPase subunit I